MNEVVIFSRRYIFRENKIDDFELLLMDFEVVVIVIDNFINVNKFG